MLRITLIAVLAISATLVASDVQAQSRRTRFFQKVKEDLFGAKSNDQQKLAQQKAEAAKKQQQARLEEARRQQIARMQQSRGRQPQSNFGRTPTPAARSGQPTSPTLRQPTPSQRGRNSSQFSSLSTAPGRSPQTSLSSSGKYKKPSTKSQRNGFGFEISKSGEDRFVVSSVDRGGNAEEAGIRRGDTLVEIGGIEATSVEEFDEIAKIMGQGDEMEFKVERSGREKELTVRYGELPDMDDENVEVEVSRSTENKRYDFSPPNSKEFSSSNSVLNSNSRVSPVYQPKARTASYSDEAGRQIKMLNQTISQQSREIQQLQQEIRRLRSGYRGR